MKSGRALSPVPEISGAPGELRAAAKFVETPIPSADALSQHRLFRMCWYGANLLLLLSICFAVYAAVWEFSTRRYLKGFSDAIIPESSSAQEKVEAIMNWMQHGPGRRSGGMVAESPDRDPTDTLNYAALMRVCGSATNAFLNLSDSAGLDSRRLLLLDSRSLTKHVVAEVSVDGRWIVVDPAFRTVFRGTDGGLLTRQQLADPAILAKATQGISGYSQAYTFDRTAHVRMARLPIFGGPIQRMLDRILPGWEDSALISLLLERNSLAALVAAIALVVLLALFRLSARWYGESRLGIRPSRIRQRARQALYAFIGTSA